jgi:hypothetical protein
LHPQKDLNRRIRRSYPPGRDGGDVFSSGVIGCNSPGCDITSSVIFGVAVVNVVPEPGTLALLGVGLAVLVLASRRDRAESAALVVDRHRQHVPAILPHVDDAGVEDQVLALDALELAGSSSPG